MRYEKRAKSLKLYGKYPYTKYRGYFPYPPFSTTTKNGVLNV
tara:strand:- start:466 stop:591 length:126 start_codon:yes stop_codon:yes gene_type:complete